MNPNISIEATVEKEQATQAPQPPLMSRPDSKLWLNYRRSPHCVLNPFAHVTRGSLKSGSC
jgi:hypothetical protein